MHIMHVALGGCFRAPPVDYGITEDTGGHIAYVLGAAVAQVEANAAVRVTIVTRAFDDMALGGQYSDACETVRERVVIRRLRTRNSAYLSKSDLLDELPALQSVFLELVAANCPDVIHAHFADAALIAIAARDRVGVPVIYTPHSLGLDKARHENASPIDDEHQQRLMRERWAIAQCDRIIVSSEDERTFQIGAYDKRAIDRTVVVRPGVELAHTTGVNEARALIAPWLTEPERPFLLAIARPVRKKNLQALLLAYACDSRLREHCNLVILAGQHDRLMVEQDEQAIVLDRLSSTIVEHDLAGRVALPPRHTPQVVAQLYRLAFEQCGVFVNPALHEPFGLTLIEAARTGVPVVATQNGGPREILARIGHGLLVDPKRPLAIADACYTLLNDSSAYIRARRAGIENGRQYCWTSWASTVDRTISRLVDGKLRFASVVPACQDGELPSRAAVRTGRCRSPQQRQRHFLACDIDGTLTGSVAGVERFRTWIDTCAAEGPIFAVATGRELPQARQVVSEWRLPPPKTWITSVGTEIWRVASHGKFVRCEAWAKRLSRYWDRDAVLSVLVGQGWHFQAERTQRPWKISLFGTADNARYLAQLPALRTLAVRVIASHGQFIDLVPARAGKAAAIAFEANRQGISLECCIAAGDSGNDADMLALCGKAILVGNALPEVQGIADHTGLYRASASHANGVLEGLQAFGLAPSLARERNAVAEVA